MGALLDEPKLRVTKIEAATRQADCAIELWFRHGDPVSICTLAQAAHQIVQDLLAARGEQDDLLFKTPLIPAEQRKAWESALKRPGNFLKHAVSDCDPRASTEIAPFIAIGLLMYAIDGLSRLGEPMSLHAVALALWLSLREPAMMSESFFARFIPPEHLEQLRALEDKAEFFEEFLELQLRACRTN